MFLLSYGIHSVWLSVAWKTADISRRLHWFPREMMSEKRA